MMNKQTKLLRAFILIIVFGFLSTSAQAEHKYLKAFPKASAGMKRFVIILPEKAQAEESNYRVEIAIGKIMETDGINRVNIGGKIEAKPLKGWGFTYYEIKRLGPAFSTKIGVPPGTPKVKKFISGPSTTINYNSRLPIVIYVPDEAGVQYRIWKAQPKFNPAKAG